MPEVNKAMVLTQAGLGLRIVSCSHCGRRTSTSFAVPPASNIRSRRIKGFGRNRRPRFHGVRLPLPQMVANALAEHIRKYPPAEDGTIFANPKQATGPGLTVGTEQRSSRPR